MLRAAALVVTFGSSLGWALPPDLILDVPAQGERFVKLPRLDWIDVEDRSVLDAEWLGATNELLLTAKKSGRTLVLLGADAQVALWVVRVGDKPKEDPAALKAAQAACKGLQFAPQGDVKLAAAVGTPACRDALFALFKTDLVEARALELTFDQLELQAQLKRFQEAAKAQRAAVQLRYLGAGLVMEGTLDDAARRKLLWALVKQALGRLPLDDRTEPPDAGAP